MPTRRLTSILALTFCAALATSVAGCRRAPAEPLAKVETETFDSLARTSLVQIDGRILLKGLTDQVEIVRDQWGVPHIYAKNENDLFFAQGFVVAQD